MKAGGNIRLRLGNKALLTMGGGVVVVVVVMTIRGRSLGKMCGPVHTLTASQ